MGRCRCCLTTTARVVPVHAAGVEGDEGYDVRVHLDHDGTLSGHSPTVGRREGLSVHVRAHIPLPGVPGYSHRLCVPGGRCSSRIF